MKLMQVFDCQDMDDGAKTALFEAMDDRMQGNDVYYDWYVGECDDVRFEMYGWLIDAQHRAVDKWLRSQTKEVDNEVLIKIWW